MEKIPLLLWMVPVLLAALVSSPVTAQAGCTSPPGLSHGQIISPSPYSHGDYITYQCLTGYTMTGAATSVLCDSGSWIGPSPVCYADCATPAGIPNSYTATSSPYNHGDYITVTMAPGMTFPDCYADCVNPSAVANAQISSFSPYAHGDYLTYQCLAGYTMTGAPSGVQCDYGSWVGSHPQCYANCPTPAYIPNSNVLTPPPYEHGVSITYACLAGHTMFNGGPSLQCDDGTWVGTFPDCYADCPNPATVSYADILTSAPYVHGDTVTYDCHYGFTMVGPASRTCDKGFFSGTGPPVCYFNCSVEDPQGVANAIVVTSYPYMHGDLMTFRCYHGYSMSGQPSQEWFNGTWTGPTPTCTFVDKSVVTEKTVVVYTPKSQSEEEMEQLFMTGMWALTGGFFLIMALILCVAICLLLRRMQCCESVEEAKPKPEPEAKEEEQKPEPRLVDKVLAARYVPKPLNHDNPWRPFKKHSIHTRETNL